MDKMYYMEWQAKMDPSRFNKSRGAQYHTAPTVVLPGAPEFPDDLPDGTVTFLYYVDSSCWLAKLEEKVVLENPMFIEKPPRKGAKHGPVLILTASEALAAIPVNENYYYAAQVVSQPGFQVLRATFSPGKVNEKTGTSKIKCVVSFIEGNA